jgi:hypothetical protein
MFGTHVEEMNVNPVDLRFELREGVQLGFALAPVVLCAPVANEFLEFGQLRTLRGVGYRSLSGHRVAIKRCRRSFTSVSGMCALKGRTALSPAAASAVLPAMDASAVRVFGVG